ncbi:MAG: prepilin peptidase [Firmicutes bacterium]|nr:prepilin peptidase [Bacillota bacterium]
MGWIKIGIFVLGVLLGSMLNSFISWWPQEQASGGPQPICPHCGHPWQGLERLSLWGMLFSRGRCHYCGDHVPLRYILVELAAGILCVLAFMRGQSTVDVLRLLSFVLLLIPLFFIDLKHHRLPNMLTLPGIGIGLLLSAGLGQLKSAIIGALTGGGLLFVAAIVTRGGLGMGDAKLQAMVGAFLGLRLMLISLTIGVILGGIVGLLLLAFRIRGRKDMIPYGPFLITGALLASLVIVTG